MVYFIKVMEASQCLELILNKPLQYRAWLLLLILINALSLLRYPNLSLKLSCKFSLKLSQQITNKFHVYQCQAQIEI